MDFTPEYFAPQGLSIPETSASSGSGLSLGKVGAIGAVVLSGLSIGGFFLYQHVKNNSPFSVTISPRHNGPSETEKNLVLELQKQREEIGKLQQQLERQQKREEVLKWRVSQFLQEKEDLASKLSPLAQNPEYSDVLEDVQNFCNICFSNKLDVILSCGHLLCSSCVAQIAPFQQNKNKNRNPEKSTENDSKNLSTFSCPFCRSEATIL